MAQLTTNLAIGTPRQTWGGMWDTYLAASPDSCQTSEARRLKIGESKMRSWIKSKRSPSMDWVLANTHRLPPRLTLELLNTIADGKYTIELIEPESVNAGDMLEHAIDLHVPVASLTKEIVMARADGVITPDEAHRLLHLAAALIAAVRAICMQLALIVGRQKAQQMFRQVWRRA